MSRHDEDHLPSWLWFFLILPLGLVVMLLYRNRRLPRLEALKEYLPGPKRPVYQEPDSIPLNMAGEYGRTLPGMASESRVGADAEDAGASFTAASRRGAGFSGHVEDEGAARMDAESPATANESSDIAEQVRTDQIPAAPRNPTHVREPLVQAQVEENQTASAQPAPTTGPDDLKIIEGIGPSIAGLLRSQGITSFTQLAGTPIETLNEILAAAGLTHLADPGTWSEQARLAADGQWEQLDDLQRTLKGGKRQQND